MAECISISAPHERRRRDPDEPHLPRQRYFYDATRKYYLLGRDGLIRGLAPPPGGSVLEIGCGTGRNLIAVARRYRDCTLAGIDVSAAMLETAQASVDRVRLGSRIALAQGDATRFDAALFAQTRFDRIFISYVLSMIPDWPAALACAAAALAEGGSLHIVDFGQQERLPRAWRRLLFAWLARFDVSPRQRLFDTLAALAEKGGLTLHRRSLFGGYAWSAVLERPRAA